VKLNTSCCQRACRRPGSARGRKLPQATGPAQSILYRMININDIVMPDVIFTFELCSPWSHFDPRETSRLPCFPLSRVKAGINSAGSIHHETQSRIPRP
jgi:hypothetical protein